VMKRRGRGFLARIAGRELDGRHPVAYAFVLRNEDGLAWRHPGLGEDLTGQPYLVIRSEPHPSTGPESPD
jgi:hypothetical protein